jgi:putative redox protein
MCISETMADLTVKLQTVDDKTMFNAEARDNPKIIVDYFPPVGTGKGYTSLELLMISFGSCVSTTLLTFLRYKMKKFISGLSVEVNGIVRKEHPKALQNISLFLRIKAKDLKEDELQEVLKIAENEICPVWSMIKGNVTIDVKTEICE